MDPLRQRTVVQPDGMIEVRSADLPPGTPVDVLVLPIPEENTGSGLRGMMGQAKGIYASPEEADRWIRSLRNEWDS